MLALLCYQHRASPLGSPRYKIEPGTNHQPRSGGVFLSCEYLLVPVIGHSQAPSLHNESAHVCPDHRALHRPA
jgi:hypothetical protein